MGKRTKERKKKAVRRKHLATKAKTAEHVDNQSPDPTDSDGSSSQDMDDGDVDVDIADAEQPPKSTSTLPGGEKGGSIDRGLKRTTPHDVPSDVDPHSVDAAATDADGWETVHRNKKIKKLPQKHKKKYPSIDFSVNARLDKQVRLADLRDLILYIFADGIAPRWVSVSNRSQVRKIVAIMIPGLEEAMFEQPDVDFSSFEAAVDRDDPKKNYHSIAPDDYYPRVLQPENLHDSLKPFADMFRRMWPVKSPGDDRLGRMHSPLVDFLTAPLPKKTKDERDTKTHVKPVREPPGFQAERTRITKFLTTRDELVDNGYVLHPALLRTGKEKKKFKLDPDWVVTKVDSLEDAEVPEEEIEEGSAAAGRQVLGIDCEMVMTGPEEFSLARISVVDWTGDVVLDRLVKPDKPVINYVTQFSGITEEMLKPVTTTLKDIQEELLKLITPRTILVGHSLDSDLKALKLTHPFIVDTSIIYPHPRGPPLKSSLKWLTQKYLSRQIQLGGAAGHNSIEDAKACLDLARQKCEKGRAWGEYEGGGENLFRRLARSGTGYNSKAPPPTGAADSVKTSAAVDWGEPSKGPGGGATHALGCRSDEDVAQAIIRAVQGDADGAEIRAGGVDFVWARMRELEAVRGWWNKNRSAGRAGGADSSGGPPDLDQLDIKDDDAAAAAKKSAVEVCVRRLVERLSRVYEALPPCTAFILFSGSGDPRDMSRLQGLRTRWKQEYNTPGMNWDQLSVKWTDTEEQALKRAVRKAREGIGFIAVK